MNGIPEPYSFDDLLRASVEAWLNGYFDPAPADEVDDLCSRLDDLDISSVARQFGIDETDEAQMSALTEMMRDVRLKAEQRSGENTRENDAAEANSDAGCCQQNMNQGQSAAWYTRADDIGDRTIANVDVARWYVQQGAAEIGEAHPNLDAAQERSGDPNWDPYIQRLIARLLTEEEIDLVCAALAKPDEEEKYELDDSLMDI